MYTVLRFESQVAGLEQLTLFGDSLNEVREGFFTGLDRIGGRFSCSVCEDDDWEKHVSAMNEILDVFQKSLVNAKDNKIEVEFDVAIEPEDYDQRFCLSMPVAPILLKHMADEGVGLTFSCYAPQQK